MLLRSATIARTLFKTLATNRAALGMAFLFSTGVQLLFYLALLALGGLPLVGLWGWIMAAVALMPLFVLGWNQGLIKHIPEALAQEDDTLAEKLLGTALTGSFLFSVLLGSLLGGLSWLTNWTAQVNTYLPPTWWTLMGWLIPGLILVPLNQALQLAIDGKQQFIIRTGIQLNGLLILVLAAPLGYRWLGESALPIALLFQQLAMFVSGLKAVKALRLTSKKWPFQWSAIAAKKLFQFGIRYQQASLLSALFDPVVKAAITAMGGLSMTGLYELGNRMVLPFRNLLVQLLQVMTPAVARLHIRAEQVQYIHTRFWENGRYGTLGALVFLACIPAFAWIFPTGDPADFRQLLHVLLLIWLINLWAAPLYYASMATGKLYDLLLVHAIQTGLAAGFLVFPAWKAAGLPLAINLSLPILGVGLGAGYLLLKYLFIVRKPLSYEPVLVVVLLILWGISWMLSGTAWFWTTPILLLFSTLLWWASTQRPRSKVLVSKSQHTDSAKSNPAALRISVITVCLNRAAFIEQTILSVQAQSYPNIEHIIVDGGSTDGTIEIIKRYESKLHYWISEPDKGMYDAINKGILQATGDYIHVLNSDDYLAGPKVYADVVAAIEATNRAPFYHGDLVKVKNGEERLIRLFECGYLPYLMSGHGSFISHPTVFMRLDWHHRLGGYSLAIPYSSDYDYLLRACRLTQDGGVHIPVTITCFREHAASFTGSGAIATEKKPMLAEHHFLLYPWWFRLGWYGLGWMFYKSLNFSKVYKKRPEVVGL